MVCGVRCMVYDEVGSPVAGSRCTFRLGRYLRYLYPVGRCGMTVANGRQ